MNKAEALLTFVFSDKNVASLVAILSRLAPVGFTFAGFQLLNFFHSPYMLTSFSTSTSFLSAIIIIIINEDESLSVPELKLLEELPIAFAVFLTTELSVVQIYPAVFTPLASIFVQTGFGLLLYFYYYFFVRLQKYAGYVKVTPNSHWGSIKMAE